MLNPTPHLQLLVTDRQAGKTTSAMLWVAEGERTYGYPGWSRILVVPTMGALAHLREQHWHNLDDFSHRVYGLPEWSRVRGAHPDVEVCLDDLDAYLSMGLPRLSGRIVAATITAYPWTGPIAIAPRT